MMIETKEKTLRSANKTVQLVAVYTEETFFGVCSKGHPVDQHTRKLDCYRLQGPTGEITLDPQFFDLKRLNAHAAGFFDVNGATFKPLAALPKESTKWNVRA